MTEEKKNGQPSYKERLAMAIQSMKGKPLPTDTELFKGDLPEKMPDRFLKKK